jgi:hypothetical protein
MDWMEFESGTELKDSVPQPVSFARAHVLLELLSAATLPPLVSSISFGLHGTTYRLKVYSPGSSCEYFWVQEPPTEWKALGEAARELQLLADEVLSAA